jgi:hypothetical protein
MTEEAMADAPTEVVGQAESTASPAPVEVVSNEEATPSNWYDGYDLADEDVGYIKNKGWDTPDKTVAAYKNLEKFHGVPPEQILKLPGEGAEADAWDAVYDRLGRPESAGDYGDFELPEGVEVDSSRVEWADGLFHKLGLNKTQRDALISANAEFESTAMNSLNEAKLQQQQADLDQLKSDWGSAYSEREELSRRAVRSFLPGDDAQKGELLNSMEDAIGSANLLRLFSNIGQQVSEDSIPSGDVRPFGYSPEQAKSDLAQLKSELSVDTNRLKAYNTGKGPDYEKMQRLIRIANNQD